MNLRQALTFVRGMALRDSPERRRAGRTAWGLAAALLLSSPVHAGFVNGGFEADTANPPSGWTLNTYRRSAVLTASPPVPNPLTGITLSQLGLDSQQTGSTVSRVITLPVSNVPSTNPGTLTAPRWGNNAFKLNDQGARVASSIQQTARMTTADIDPIDNKIHLRFGMAPVLVDGGHGPTEQPYFYVEVFNTTKGRVLFSTYNYASQSGVPWQMAGNYRYTDWQGFDISPGNGLLDVGDDVKLIVYASNCQPGAADHEARVYLDAVGAFMPGLTVAATGPTSVKPGEQIAYTYNYSNGSGAIALGAKVRVAAPKTENGLFTTFVTGSLPDFCAGPTPGADLRSEYYDCDVGDLSNGAGGSFNVTFAVPATAATTAPNNVVNNGDYDIRANTVSAFIGPLVKANIIPVATATADLGVTIDNGGLISYAATATPIYTVTVTNHSAQAVTGATVTQSLTGVTGGTWQCSVPTGSSASCGASVSGDGPISTTTAGLPANQSLVYTYTGTSSSLTAGTPANTVVTVAPPSGTQDTQSSNNTAGLNTPVAASQQNVTVNASGTGTGGILAVPAPLACAAPCSTTGVTRAAGTGDEIRLTAVADTGSIFKGWTGCTTVTGNLCVVTMGSSAVTATAEFARAYMVTPTVSGGGSIGPNTPQQIEQGGSRVFTFTPDTGLVPVIDPPASGTACTGALAGNTYTVSPVNADCGFTVRFTTGVTLTSSVTGGNGTISPSGPTGLLSPGNNSTAFTLTPATGYTPVVSGTCTGTLAGNTYTVTNAASNCTVIASFTNDPVTVTSSVSGGNGTIDTTGAVNLPRGGSRIYTFAPATGYYPLVTGNCPGRLVGNTYTVDPVNANCTFSVAFSNQTVDITAAVTSGTGTITPSGTTTVAQGGGQTFTAAPGAGNQTVFGGTCQGVRTGNDFTVTNTQANCNVEVRFVPAANAITVTTSVPGGNGSVATPGQNAAGETVLAVGDTRVWTLTPGTPGSVPSVVPGSTCTGLLSATAPYTYTVTNATTSCAVAFAFRAAVPASIPTLSEWGLIILSVLMGLSMLVVRRRQMR